MEQINVRTQGFIEGSKKSLKDFRAGREMYKRLMKESVNKTTGEIIPAHYALCFFVAKRNADGTKMLGANGNPIAEPDTMEYVNFGPSVGENISVAELSAQRNELEVGYLQSGNAVLYKPNYNGVTGEAVEEW